MPRLTDPASQHQYAQPVPQNLAPIATMTYYTRSAMPAAGYYTEVAPGAHQAMAAYDQYAVGTAPLTIPPNAGGGGVGGPVGSSSLPAQHRASSGAWNQTDDQALLAARQSGQNWTQIQAAYFPGKTPNACRKRHERLMERRGADDWDTRRMEHIAKEYMSLRKEIWAPLAQRTGQKWQVVEQKCMSNGIKNLQSHARSYSRKQRNGQQPVGTGYDDDSAVSGIGLTPVDDLDPGADGGYSSPEAPSSASSGGGSAGDTGSSSLQPQGHYGGSVGAHSMHGSGSFHGYTTHPGYGHAYTSSVSSNGTPGYVSGGAVGGHVGQSDGPYMAGHRQSSADMDIKAIINRPGGSLRQV